MSDNITADGVIVASKMERQDVYDCLSVMLMQELHYSCHDYLHVGHREVTDYYISYQRCDPIDESCRSKMAEWCYTVVDCSNLRRETVSIAMGYLDRFLCTSSIRAVHARFDRKEYQLAAMTTLYMAVKIFEPLEMDAVLVSTLSRGLHSASDIVKTEHEILVALSWRVNDPSPHQFSSFFLELLPLGTPTQEVAHTMYDCCQFQIELATGDYAYVPLRRSIVSVASVLNALEGIAVHDLPLFERMEFIGSLSEAVNYDIFSPIVNVVRVRLLESFAKSSGYELPQVGVFPAISKPAVSFDESSLNSENIYYESIESPICMADELNISYGFHRPCYLDK